MNEQLLESFARQVHVNGEVPTPAINYTGHLPNSGGLQGHSIGSAYPFTVVGVLWADPDDRKALADHSAANRRTRYIVLDCSTGKTYTRGHGRSYATSEVAHRAAAWLNGEGEIANILRPQLWTS